MKLLVQIPCLNESQTLPAVLASIPRSIPGISKVEIVVIDDGSTDGTREVALQHGADEVVRNTSNLGLAFTFRRGIDACLHRGADIIVNMDGDNQYRGEDIHKLIEPILKGEADIVIGDRRTASIQDFSASKKFLQWFGSAIVRGLSDTKVRDAVSGFRAFSRTAAIKLTILSNYSYTIESILQARSKGLTLTNVEISTNPKTRDSRLMSNIRTYLAFSVATIVRVFTMYNPLKVFLYSGASFVVMGTFLVGRFVYFYLFTPGVGLIQSLILAAILITTGAAVILFGLVADLIQFNRRLTEDLLERVKELQFRSHI